jgi:hypothetical protein
MLIWLQRRRDVDALTLEAWLRRRGGGGGGPDIICGPCAIYVNDNGVLPYLTRSSTPVIFSPYKNIPPNFFGTCDAFSGSLRGVCTGYDSQLICLFTLRHLRYCLFTLNPLR